MWKDRWTNKALFPKSKESCFALSRWVCSFLNPGLNTSKWASSCVGEGRLPRPPLAVLLCAHVGFHCNSVSSLLLFPLQESHSLALMVYLPGCIFSRSFQNHFRLVPTPSPSRPCWEKRQHRELPWAQWSICLLPPQMAWHLFLRNFLSLNSWPLPSFSACSHPTVHPHWWLAWGMMSLSRGVLSSVLYGIS